MEHGNSESKDSIGTRSISSVKDEQFAVRAKLLIYLSSDVGVRIFRSNMMPSRTPANVIAHESERERERETYSR